MNYDKVRSITNVIQGNRSATPISRESPVHATPTDGVLPDDIPSHTGYRPVTPISREGPVHATLPADFSADDFPSHTGYL